MALRGVLTKLTTQAMKTKAYLLESNAGLVVYCRRDKFKHCYKVGAHEATDKAFYEALKTGTLEWARRVYTQQLNLFQKNCRGLR